MSARTVTQILADMARDFDALTSAADSAEYDAIADAKLEDAIANAIVAVERVRDWTPDPVDNAGEHRWELEQGK